MIFVDSGAWYASIVTEDPDHARAVAWRATNRQSLITTDYIIDETLTLLRSRGEPMRARAFGRLAFGSKPPFRLYYLTPDDIRAAWGVFERFADKEWSFTDCTSKVVIERLGLDRAFAFDQHFRQFGTVAVVP